MQRRAFSFSLVLAVMTAMGAYACGGDDTLGPIGDGGSDGSSSGNDSGSSGFDSSSDFDSGGGSDSGGNKDTGGGSDTGADVKLDGPASDGGFAVVNGCLQNVYVDRTAAGANRDIAFPNGPNPQPYNPPCMKISRTQMVTWGGDFTKHPLAPGNQPGNPIPATSTGNTLQVTFPAVGVYGFHCTNHPTVMQGAIWVVP